MEVRDLEYDGKPLLTVTRGFVRTIYAVRLQVQQGWSLDVPLPVLDPEDLPIVMLTDFLGRPADFGHTDQRAHWQSGGTVEAGGRLRAFYVSSTWRTYGPALTEGSTCRVYVHPLADVDLSSWS